MHLDDVQEDVPRLLMNREVVGEAGVGYFDGVYRGRTSTGKQPGLHGMGGIPGVSV